MTAGLYTLDVGHGLCQCILLQGRRAILVDGGSYTSREVPASFLDRFVDRIELYLASHNDSDHVGAAIHLLERPRFKERGRVVNAAVVIDRPSDRLPPLMSYLRRRESEGTLERLVIGHVVDRESLEPRLLFRDRHSRLSVKLLYPRLVHSFQAVFRSSASGVETNRAGMIVRIDCGHASVLIPGDVDCEALRRVIQEYGFDLRVKVLTVPHHAGRLVGSPAVWSEVLAHIAPEIAVVSTGTARTVVSETSLAPLAMAGVPVCCTQITGSCHPDPTSFAPSVTPMADIIGLSGRPGARHVGCFGTVVIGLEKAGIEVFRLAEHQAAVDSRVSLTGRPACRVRGALPD